MSTIKLAILSVPACSYRFLRCCRSRRIDVALDIAPTALAGREVRVYWEDDDAWYLGTVSGFSAVDHLHLVRTRQPVVTPICPDLV